MKKIKVIIVFVVGMLVGCLIHILILKSTRDDLNNSLSPRLDFISNIHLVDQLVKTGDTILYERLRGYYYDKPSIDFLGISLIMANKYDYTPAYVDVFDAFHAVLRSGNSADIHFNFSNYDLKSKNIALEYLNIAADKNNPTAIEYRCKYDKDCDYNRISDSIAKVIYQKK